MEKVMSNAQKVISAPDKPLSKLDKVISAPEKVICVTDKPLSVTEKVISGVDKVIFITEKVLSKPQKVTSAMETPLPAGDLGGFEAKILIFGQTATPKPSLRQAPSRKLPEQAEFIWNSRTQENRIFGSCFLEFPFHNVPKRKPQT